MKILIAMLGRKKGGIEQAFIDYIESLALRGNEIIALADKYSPILDQIPTKNTKIETITNLGKWDPIAVIRIKHIITKHKPDIIITHANRATTLIKRAEKHIPIVGVCHNYNLNQLIKCEYLFTITNDIKNQLIARGKNPDNIFIIPNMINIDIYYNHIKKRPNSIPTIGAIGRFVEKKGFDIYLKALSELKNRNIKFKAILAGNGEEEYKLKELSNKLGLDDYIDFVGWVENKNKFYSSIDIFCLPSLHEPFGIVLLEAYLYALPIITTDTEGPIEIVKPEEDAIVIEKGNAEMLAKSMIKLIKEQSFAKKIADNGYKKVISQYDSKIVGKLIEDCLKNIININKNK